MIENAATSSPTPACDSAGDVFATSLAHTNHNGDITRRLAHEYIEKLAEFAVETAEQGTAAIILREHIRRLENTVKALTSSVRAYEGIYSASINRQPSRPPSSSVGAGG